MNYLSRRAFRLSDDDLIDQIVGYLRMKDDLPEQVRVVVNEFIDRREQLGWYKRPVFKSR